MLSCKSLQKIKIYKTQSLCSSFTQFFKTWSTVCIRAKADESLPAVATVDNDGCSSQEVLLLALPDRLEDLAEEPQHRLQAK